MCQPCLRGISATARHAVETVSTGSAVPPGVKIGTSAKPPRRRRMGGRNSRAAARLFLPPILLRRGGFAEVPIFTPGGTAEPVLTVSTACRAVAEIPLRHGWHIYGFELETVPPSAVDDRTFLELTFSLNRLAPGSWH